MNKQLLDLRVRHDIELVRYHIKNMLNFIDDARISGMYQEYLGSMIFHEKELQRLIDENSKD